MFASYRNPPEFVWQTLPGPGASLPCTGIATSRHARGVSFKTEQVCDYTRQTIQPLTDLAHLYGPDSLDDKTVYKNFIHLAFHFELLAIPDPEHTDKTDFPLTDFVQI
ncbi:hypothetical protein AVEN_228465-1 [Araneus ventricosus]|uniref:Uncharacterized protein n=1 Tax=Araneus ventricosus TaxID=182803 RepID=A0A4Y2UWW2_ARAVE|nr:hypothetical protein AVEN_228465-1 [Araneus ventricosus]